MGPIPDHHEVIDIWGFGGRGCPKLSIFLKICQYYEIKNFNLQLKYNAISERNNDLVESL